MGSDANKEEEHDQEEEEGEKEEQKEEDVIGLMDGYCNKCSLLSVVEKVSYINCFFHFLNIIIYSSKN